MPWKTMDVREQRVSFVVTARRGEKPLQRPVPGVWHLASDRVFVAGAVSEDGSGGHCRAQPAAAPQSGAYCAGVGSAGGRHCGGAIRTGGRASCRCCCAAAGSSCRAARSTASCCATVWCRSRSARSGDAAVRAQRAQRAVADGLQRADAAAADSWGRCRCSTTTAAT